MSLRLCKNMWECVYILYVYLHSLLIYCILHINVYIYMYMIILYVSFFLFFILVASAPRQRNPTVYFNPVRHVVSLRCEGWYLTMACHHTTTSKQRASCREGLWLDPWAGSDADCYDGTSPIERTPAIKFRIETIMKRIQRSTRFDGKYVDRSSELELWCLAVVQWYSTERPHTGCRLRKGFPSALDFMIMSHVRCSIQRYTGYCIWCNIALDIRIIDH